jgi:fatty acid desaturase
MYARGAATVEDGTGAAELLYRPAVSLPAVATLAVAIATWVAAACLLRPAFAVVVASWSIYACFTVLHDASHHSVSNVRWLNELVGRVAAIPFLIAPFVTFR